MNILNQISQKRSGNEGNLGIIADARRQIHDLRAAYKTDPEGEVGQGALKTAWQKMMAMKGELQPDFLQEVPDFITEEIFGSLEDQLQIILPKTKRWKRMVQAFKRESVHRYRPEQTIVYSDRAYRVDEKGCLRRLPQEIFHQILNKEEV